MPKYLLTYGQPCVSVSGSAVVYERRHLRCDHPDDATAIKWAHQVVPHECCLTQDGTDYLAVPMMLERIEGRARSVVF